MSRGKTVHETRLRVRYGEVDRMGVAYHANYLVWFESGRTEFLRSLGGTYRRLEEEGTLLMVVESGVRHHKPAAYDDLITVHTRLAELRPVRMRFEYEIRRDEDLLATGFTILAATDTSGRPHRTPATFREVLGRSVEKSVQRGRVPGNGKATPRSGVQGAQQ